MPVYESFENRDTVSSGIVPNPLPNERLIGWHAVLCCGFDDEHQSIIVRNSYGMDWGLGGYFYLKYHYLPMCLDFWTVKIIS
jgi:C1A family cysteine protease